MRHRNPRRAPGAAACVAFLGLLILQPLLAACAHAQMNSLMPSFGKLTSGSFWGAASYSDVANPERFALGNHHPILRGGFAAMLGPFGGQPDTIVTLDSLTVSTEWVARPSSIPGATRVDTVRTVRSVRSHRTNPGRDGWISLAVGYQYAAAVRVNVIGPHGTLASTFPIGGFYVSTFLGPYPLWRTRHHAFWYATVGGSTARVEQANGTSLGTLVRFDTERTIVPEASLLLGWRVHRGIRVITGVGAQHIRFSSIRYRSPSEAPLDDAVLRRLPDSLRLTSVFLKLGMSFDASDLFGK
jgi:hypothetical protein